MTPNEKKDRLNYLMDQLVENGRARGKMEMAWPVFLAFLSGVLLGSCVVAVFLYAS